MELGRCFILFFFIYYGLVLGNDVDFSSCPLNPGYLVDCTILLDVDCDENCNTGTISSPCYPDRMPDIDYWGKYKLIIKSCPNSIITLTLSEDQFDLGPQSNSFIVGNGEDVSGQIISPKLNGGFPDVFPNGEPTLLYTSSNSSLWMNVDVSSGCAKFNITYFVSVLESTFTMTYSTQTDPSTSTTLAQSVGTTSAATKNAASGFAWIFLVLSITSF